MLYEVITEILQMVQYFILMIVPQINGYGQSQLELGLARWFMFIKSFSDNKLSKKGTLIYVVPFPYLCFTVYFNLILLTTLKIAEANIIPKAIANALDRVSIPLLAALLSLFSTTY